MDCLFKYLNIDIKYVGILIHNGQPAIVKQTSFYSNIANGTGFWSFDAQTPVAVFWFNDFNYQSASLLLTLLCN